MCAYVRVLEPGVVNTVTYIWVYSRLAKEWSPVNSDYMTARKHTGAGNTREVESIQEVGQVGGGAPWQPAPSVRNVTRDNVGRWNDRT